MAGRRALVVAYGRVLARALPQVTRRAIARTVVRTFLRNLADNGAAGATVNELLGADLAARRRGGAAAAHDPVFELHRWLVRGSGDGG